MDRINEIQARLAAIATEIETANGEAFTALETEARGLTEELNTLRAEATRKQELRKSIAAGAGTPAAKQPAPQENAAEKRAAAFRNSNRMTIEAEESRAVMVSGGTLVQPTKTSGINDIPGAKVSSIIDLVHVENCVGMGGDRVAYVDADMNEAGKQTEGGAAGTGEPTFKFVDIKPTSYAVLSQISDQAKKQTNLQYEAKVKEQALLALRKKAAAVASQALMNSELVANLVVSGIDATTLRKIVLTYGDDDSVLGGAVLFLTKKALLAFGDVRGENEKKAVYTITPDASNPNTGVIVDGGLSVRYCLNSNLPDIDGYIVGGETVVGAMFYGDPKALKLDLFSDYEIKVSEDFAFDKRMDTIRGAVDMGAAVVVKNGFISVNLGE